MITTIFGDIEAKTVGHILPHEHVMSDMSRMLKPTGDPEFYEPLSLSNYGLVRLNPFSIRDNAIIRDENLIIYELKKFKELLDMGIITQEEFDAKKKQLLGL